MRLLPLPLLLLLSSQLSLPARADPVERYHESLSLVTLPDGKVHSSFRFDTFSPLSPPLKLSGANATAQHHTLLSPLLSSLLLTYRIATFSLTLSSGRWSPHWPSTGESLPPSGIELNAWLELLDDETEQQERKRWSGFVGAVGGLFCAGVGKATEGGLDDSPAWGWQFDGVGDPLEHRFYHLLLPRLSATCTESLTPFISLLPCASYAGIASLLNPHKLFDGDWTLIGIEYKNGEWNFRIGSVVDPVRADRLKGGLGRREFSFSSIYGRVLRRSCPVAHSTLIQLELPPDSASHEPFSIEPRKTAESLRLDGKEYAVWDASLLDGRELDLSVKWELERVFRYPHPSTLPQPLLMAKRLLTGYGQERGHIGVELVAREPMEVIWSETWPWWLRTFTGRLTVESTCPPFTDDVCVGTATSEIVRLSYTPSIPRMRPTTLQAVVRIPQGTTRLLLPFEAAYLRYTEYPPDAHRGFELPSATIFYTQSNESSDGDEDEGHKTAKGERRRRRLSTESTLLSLPTPDFSMPYNVIILTSTVVALFFGSVVNPLVRKWVVIDLEEEEEEVEGDKKQENGQG